MPVDRETGRPRGFAFVEFADRRIADEVIRRFNSQSFKGRPLAVSEARPREDRPPGSRPPGPRPMGGPPPPGGRFPTGPRPAGPRPGFGDAPAGPSDRSRNFGPDAPPRRKRAQARPQKERQPRGPIPERGGGRFYDLDEFDEETEQLAEPDTEDIFQDLREDGSPEVAERDLEDEDEGER